MTTVLLEYSRSILHLPTTNTRLPWHPIFLFLYLMPCTISPNIPWNATLIYNFVSSTKNPRTLFERRFRRSMTILV
ncbi:hypothetical protein PHLCEN_2v10023 [Hermanssonia centrifuga]|uniref:Uncharacterized protein n=1 Tax=Hermanssonia centrifuga TaxID=98765 RepID=A0A2R6NP26_9APHY|nr:hypothetical protein PHLCEN_2v10023 [Hermanssonia centrifuga]